MIKRGMLMSNYMIKITMTTEIEIYDEESLESAKNYVQNELDNYALPFDFEIKLEEV
jgi:hypothetical protein